MVSRLARRLPLLALTVLVGAVGIEPRRQPGSGRRDESPSLWAPPAVSPPSLGIAPLTAGRVGIAPRVGAETQPRRHYWHDHGGRRYSHYFDGSVHWYGYPYGAGFYWLRPYGGFWWWWDARLSRWAYWRDGYWWWEGPGGVSFIYADAGARGPYLSPDERRLVEISGPEAQAILYDKTSEPPAYIRLLGKDAWQVRFSSGAPGTPAAIIVDFRGGAAVAYDYDGRRLEGAPPAAVKKEAPSLNAPPPPPGDPAPN